MHKIYDGYRPRISTTAIAACPAVFLTEGVTLFTTEIHPTTMATTSASLRTCWPGATGSANGVRYPRGCGATLIGDRVIGVRVTPISGSLVGRGWYVGL